MGPVEPVRKGSSTPQKVSSVCPSAGLTHTGMRKPNYVYAHLASGTARAAVEGAATTRNSLPKIRHVCRDASPMKYGTYKSAYASLVLAGSVINVSTAPLTTDMTLTLNNACLTAPKLRSSMPTPAPVSAGRAISSSEADVGFVTRIKSITLSSAAATESALVKTKSSASHFWSVCANSASPGMLRMSACPQMAQTAARGKS